MSTSIKITVNDQGLEISSPATIADLLNQLNITTRAIAVELNHEIQPADSFPTHRLKTGDALEIVTLVGGG